MSSEGAEYMLHMNNLASPLGWLACLSIRPFARLDVQFI